MAKELDRWGIIGKRGQINLVGKIYQILLINPKQINSFSAPLIKVFMYLVLRLFNRF